MILPSLDSWTDPATMDTSMEVRAYRRLHAYEVPAKLTTPASASRVMVSPAVASRARRVAWARGARSA
jgi:hypothetical protein